MWLILFWYSASLWFEYFLGSNETGGKPEASRRPPVVSSADSPESSGGKKPDREAGPLEPSARKAQVCPPQTPETPMPPAGTKHAGHRSQEEVGSAEDQEVPDGKTAALKTTCPPQKPETSTPPAGTKHAGHRTQEVLH